MEEIEKKIKILAGIFNKIIEHFKLSEKQEKLNELEAETKKLNFWEDQEAARKVMQNINNLKDEIEEYQSLQGEIHTLVSLVKEKEVLEDFKNDIEKIEKRVKKLELNSFLSGIYDRRNAIVSIHAGQGGTEAMDWASILYRMYLKYCERRGWKTEILDYSEGDEAGIKSITFKVEGPYSYGYLKGEAGTHRLVRQSPFNADRLRQTSFALVEVLPEFEESDLPEIEIKSDDLEWQFFRSSSQGGQNVQKVSTAVRLKHKPSDIVVTAQTERYQEQNRKIALSLLRGKLWVREQVMKEKKVKELKGEYRPASWGNQIRSYVLHPYKMIKDLRTKVEVSNPEIVLNGDLDKFIEAELLGQKIN